MVSLGVGLEKGRIRVFLICPLEWEHAGKVRETREISNKIRFSNHMVTLNYIFYYIKIVNMY